MRDSHKSNKHRKNFEEQTGGSKSKKRHRGPSASILSSDSDKSRGGRKRKREDSKRKRVRCSSSGGEDALALCRRKTKKSKQHDGSKEKKNSTKGNRASPTRQRRRMESRSSRRNRRRRSPSVCSLSSYSGRSCSTCRDCSSNSSGESEHERSRRSAHDNRSNNFSKRDRPTGGKRAKRNLVEYNERNKNRYKRYRSCSSCSGCSGNSSYLGRERLMGENSAKGFRSVVSAKSSKQKGRSDQGTHGNTNEIILASDDYPHCRSNDCYDQGRKRESAMLLSAYDKHVPEKNRRIEEGGVWNTDASSPHFARPGKASQDIHKDNAPCGRNEAVTTICELVSSDAGLGKKSDISTDFGSFESEDLELLLRKRALENFKKFRNGLPTQEKSLANRRTENKVCLQSTADGENHQHQPPEYGDGNVGVTQETVKSTSNVRMLSKGAVHNNNCENETWVETNRRDPNPVAISKNSSETNNKSIAIDGFKQAASKFVCGPSSNRSFGTVREMGHVDSVKSMQAGDDGISCGASSWNKNQNISKQVSKLDEPSREKLPDQMPGTTNILDKKAPGMPQTAAGSSEVHDGEVSKVHGSAHAVSQCDPDKGASALNDSKVEGRDGLHFQKKTMSVMRGGEMVQVSYKVYIPQKPSSSARRQLQR